MQLKLQKWSPDLELLHTWTAHEWPILSLAGDPGRLFSSSLDGEIKEWDTESGEFRALYVLAVSANFFYG